VLLRHLAFIEKIDGQERPLKNKNVCFYVCSNLKNGW